MDENFKVIPTNNKVVAPAIYVDSKKIDDAIKEARKKSGLSRFKNWKFIPISYKTKK